MGAFVTSKEYTTVNAVGKKVTPQRIAGDASKFAERYAKKYNDGSEPVSRQEAAQYFRQDKARAEVWGACEKLLIEYPAYFSIAKAALALIQEVNREDNAAH